MDIFDFIIKFLSKSKEKNVKHYYSVNVDKPTKTVTIHGQDSPYGPDKDSVFKQSESSGNYESDGGWFTGLTLEQAEEIAYNYQKKGYTLKRYYV